MNVPDSEILRYLGMGGRTPAADLAARVARVKEAVLAAAAPARVARRLAVGIAPAPDGGAPEVVLSDGAFVCRVASRTAAKHLNGCAAAFLFTATLGAAVDLLLRRWSQTAPADALIGQAVGAAAIETWCDDTCAWLAREHAHPGETLRPRFSPGYGDFPLTLQRPLLDALDAARRAGVSLTAANMMTPSKSVSGIVGIDSHAC